MTSFQHGLVQGLVLGFLVGCAVGAFAFLIIRTARGGKGA